MNKHYYFFIMLLLFCSFTYAASDWQTSIYSSETGLQITYPKLDFYKVDDHNITFNFNVFDINNTHLDNMTTQCLIFIFQNNGTRIINQPLNWDGNNFYYHWNTSNYTAPQNFYYTVFCNQLSDQTIIARGFTSNNFRLNIDRKSVV